MSIKKTKKEVRKTAPQVEDDFGICEIDVRELTTGIVQFLAVEKVSFFILALRVVDITVGTDLLRAQLTQALNDAPITPKRIVFKKGVYADILQRCAEERQIPWELVTKFKTIPSIIRDLNAMMPELSGAIGTKLAPALSMRTESAHTDTSWSKPEFVAHEPYEHVYRFKVSLRDIKPTIWRRIEVPATYTFFELAIAILNAMGWVGSHLHDFSIAQKDTARRVTIKIPHPDDGDFGDMDSHNELEERIGDYFGTHIKQCVFAYDFGDGWEHTVLFEGAFPREEKVAYPRITGGKNACPPEDCGGVGGYEHLREVLKDQHHPEHEDMLE